MNVTLAPVTEHNWRNVASIEVRQEQQQYVAEPAYYLALCCYGSLWKPLAIYAGEAVVGFLMWAIDPDDGSCWLGGIIVDRRHQREGYGRAAVLKAIEVLGAEHDVHEFALSYQEGNRVARSLYGSIGFRETGEREDDELVARYRAD